MKLDPGMHIGLHLVFFGKSGVTDEVGGVGKTTPRRSPITIYWPRLSPILFSFFPISKTNFGLKIIAENPEIIIKTRKILRKLRKIQENY
jgi:hypothetical protein